MLALSRRAALSAVLAASVPMAVHAQTAEINFGIVSTDGSQNLRTQWEPFLQDMARATGLKVNGFYPSDYAGVIEGMRFNKVQVAWFGNSSAIQAVDRAEGEVFVQKTYASGELGYYSILVTHRDSAIRSLDDVLKAAPGTFNLGNGDPNSTSGFLIPGYYAWARNGVDVRRLFKNVVSANHTANLLAVVNKQVDLATNNTEDLDKFRKAQPERAAMVREVWRSPLIPADPLVWRKDLDLATKDKVRAFILAYGTDRPGADGAAERRILANLGGWGPFRPSTNAQLLPIRQVAVFREKLQTEDNATLSAEDKAKRLQDIDARLRAIDAEMEKARTAS